MSQQEKELGAALKKWKGEKKSTLHSNLKYRWISTLSALGIAFALVYLFGLFARMATDIVSQVVVFAYLVFLIYLPASYYVKSMNQIMSEYSLNYSIYETRKQICNINRRKEEDRDLRSLQTRVRKLHSDLSNFVRFSGVLTPVIRDYELNRLYMAIDTFFSVAGEVLLEDKSWTFSRMHAIEKKEQDLDDYLQWEPTEKEIEDHLESERREQDGLIESFDFQAFDESLLFLGDTLFYRTKAYSFFSTKHSINLVRLSRFFDSWNNILSSCRNSKKAYAKASNDIQIYYEKIEKRETEHQQRTSDLKISLLTIFVSVTLSAVVSMLLGR